MARAARFLGVPVLLGVLYGASWGFPARSDGVSFALGQSLPETEPQQEASPPPQKSCCKGKKAAARAAADEVAASQGRGSAAGSEGAASPDVRASGGHASAEGHMRACCGVMPMSFQTSTHTVILFKQWETLDPFSFWASCVLWFFLGSASVGMKLLRLRIELATAKAPRSLPAKRGAACAAAAPLARRALFSAFSTFVYGYDYLLMLVVMTFNVYLFFAVTLGLGFGVFCVGHRLRPPLASGEAPSKLSPNDCEASRLDPCCCGA